MQARLSTITVPDPETLITHARIPVLTTTSDSRATCRLAHDYLAAHDYAAGLPARDASDLPAYAACPSYRAGACAGSHQTLCLFVEPPTSRGWANARTYRQLPDGSLCCAKTHAQSLADLHAWPIAKPTADLVARTFGIEADASGAVRNDRYLTITRADLELALAWCLALLNADESEIPAILAAWAPRAAKNEPDAAIKLPASAIYGALSHAALRGVRLAETATLLVEVVLCSQA